MEPQKKAIIARKVAQFTSLFFMGAQLGVTYSHLLQAPGKAKLPPEVFMLVQTVLLNYQVGVGVIEVGTLLPLLIALVLVRNRKVWVLTFASLLCVIGMWVIWTVFIEPINQQLDIWTPGLTTAEVPANWMELRDRWHFFHFVRFCLAALSMSLLIFSVLVDKPTLTRGDRAI